MNEFQASAKLPEKGHNSKKQRVQSVAFTMADKYLINSPEDCVKESLFGFSKLHPHLFVDLDTNVVFNPSDSKLNSFAVISGGGSGHEPFPAGFVGEGMLTASVSGSIFTSPPAKHILQAIRLAGQKSKKVLLVIPNYTGDVLNFGLAAEIASREGYKVLSHIVGEDVSQEVHGVSKAGKRGMCGLVLFIKLIRQEKWDNISDSETNTISRMKESMASMGLCLAPCSKPGFGPLFHLNPDEIELGVGVHGEAGIAKVKMMTANEAVATLLQYISESLQLSPKNEVVVLVNNLGGLSRMEEWLVAGEVTKQLSDKNITVARLYSGCFFTSLNMSGVQVCVLKVEPVHREFILENLDATSNAPAWRNIATSHPKCLDLTPRCVVDVNNSSFRLSDEETTFLKDCFVRIADDLIKKETYLNYLDGECGDGDCGSTFSKLANVIKNRIDSLEFSDPGKLFFDLSLLTEESIGGTTGALYALFFNGISETLRRENNWADDILSSCWSDGVEIIRKYGKAEIGDRTMLDALQTGCEKFKEELRSGAGEAFKKAVTAAENGCQRTKSMEAKAGRASYINRERVRDVDAGAYAVVVWLNAINEVLNERKQNLQTHR